MKDLRTRVIEELVNWYGEDVKEWCEVEYENERLILKLGIEKFKEMSKNEAMWDEWERYWRYSEFYVEPDPIEDGRVGEITEE